MSCSGGHHGFLISIKNRNLVKAGPIGTKLSRNVPWMVFYKFMFFVPVGYSTWLPGPIICSDWLKFQRSSSQKLAIFYYKYFTA
jgi:hypothetical protein